jgi:hypothetical protein
MQQECLSKSIMTSTVATLAAVLLCGCAALPDDAPFVEQLDEQTGLTVARLGRPIELYREVFRKNHTDRFGFIGPFETNQMGKRELFLWVATPTEADSEPSTPKVMLDGSVLELGAPGRAPDFAGLRSSPYKIPTPWIASFYFRIDSALVERLAVASSIGVEVTEDTRAGTVTAQYAARLEGDPRLREFAANH